MSNRERVLVVIKASPTPLDDDQIAHRSGIKPRQTVNRLCRELAQAGVLQRSEGANGKIVNLLVSDLDRRRG